MWSSDYSWLYYTVLVGILPSERRWDDVTWLRPCSSVLQKQCCEPKMAELQEVCRKDPLVTWRRSQVSPPMCPVACTNINQIMFFLLGWVNILSNITIILQRGYLGSTDRHCKHTIENRSPWSSLECHKSLLFEVILLFSSIVYHCHHTMILLW